MTELLVPAVILLPAVIALCRDLIALCCQVARRASIERIIGAARGRMMILDSAADGARLVVEVQPAVAVMPSGATTKDHDK